MVDLITRKGGIIKYLSSYKPSTDHRGHWFTSRR